MATRGLNHWCLGLALALLMNAAAAPTRADELRSEIEATVRDYLAQHPEEMQRFVREALIKNPAILQEALAEMLKQRRTASPSAPDKSAAVKANAALIFESPHQVTIGNRNGTVTLVEFFDYSCGYCKRALADMATLLRDEPSVRIVLKEFPILGPGSKEAAQVAVAVRMQDPKGDKYLAFHQKLLAERGPANRETALAAAREAGLDMTRLESEMGSDEVEQTLAENMRLAQALGINGTPTYVVGDSVIAGAVGTATLKAKLQGERDRIAASNSSREPRRPQSGPAAAGQN